MTSVPAMARQEAAALPLHRAAVWCRTHAHWLWAAWFVGFATASALWPRDISLDVMHYHIHNGWAALNGRMDIDYAPANLHSFINPYFQLVVWWLIERLPGPAVAFLLGLVHAALLPALYWFARNLTRAIGMGERRLTCVLVAIAGMGADPVMKLFASIRHDHVGATAFLAALALCVPPDSRAPDLRRLALAGALVGLLFGLKSTNAVYVVGLAVMVFAMVPGLLGRVRAALAAAAGGLAGIAVGGGAWYADMWLRFGNPMFPNLNSVFNAPLGPETSFPGYIRVPETLGEALSLPLRAAFDGGVVNWYPTTDLRIALVYLAAIGLLATLALRGRIPALAGGAVAIRPMLALALTILVTLFVWMATFATHRYAMALWAMAPLAGIVLVHTLKPSLFDRPLGLILGLTALLLLNQTTTYAKVNRQPWQSWTERYVWAERPDDFPERGAFILFTDAYSSTFVAPALGPGHVYGHVPIRRWSEPSLARYRQPMLEALAAHDGPVFVATNSLGDFEDVTMRTLEATGLQLDRTACRAMRTCMEQELHLPDRGPVTRGVLLCEIARD